MFTKLLETPLSPSKLTNIHVVLMVDLSKPEELWFTLETLVGMLQSHLDIALRTQEATQFNVEEKLKLKSKAAADSEHPDKEYIKPFNLPLIILGPWPMSSLQIVNKQLQFFKNVINQLVFFQKCQQSTVTFQNC